MLEPIFKVKLNVFIHHKLNINPSLAAHEAGQAGFNVPRHHGLTDTKTLESDSSSLIQEVSASLAPSLRPSLHPSTFTKGPREVPLSLPGHKGPSGAAV